ncbi:AzlD domain-containing protein [Zooshikella harenae]|uniref:AzlD domain-containing protein n=1 Tax=Zooshikella harenae TaxID=2827238 RepID=A0ABS5ZEF7_9GAMM|nr:AzlD domain-containing protein [Zooshikella harenae]MBU2712448.1 AzlD domain-containing protein [Zooshikella harenae]
MFEVLLITGMCAVTYLIRSLLFLAAQQVRLSTNTQQALSFVPVAVLSAIIAPAILSSEQQTLNLSIHNPALIAAVAAIIVAWWKNSLLFTLVAGISVFMLSRWGLTSFI